MSSTILVAAQELDDGDALSKFRSQFVFPKSRSGKNPLYFAGHSLGLMPVKAPEYVQEEMKAWGEFAVEGHFEGKHPWLPYHENITPSFANLVGARESEVVAMNTLTVNLHLLMVSFYQPTKTRFKILIEENSFPSDKYAVDSQAKFHGFDSSQAVVEIKPRVGEATLRQEDIEAKIKELGDSLSLVMLGNCNYLSGQQFDFKKITTAGQAVGALVGFNLAHGAGNLFLQLHDWSVDFAVWCSYKYLNSGPGGIAGAFIHEKHLTNQELPRFQGWWGTNKKSRFKMGPQFEAIPTIEAWQLSNPPIWQLASLRASMELFDQAGMQNLRERGDRLTEFFESTLKSELGDDVHVVTPKKHQRGSMLCLQFKKLNSDTAKLWMKSLHAKDITVDFREPNIIRATPAPLYNSFLDIAQLVTAMKQVIMENSK
jgi:kynureninase